MGGVECLTNGRGEMCCIIVEKYDCINMKLRIIASNLQIKIGGAILVAESIHQELVFCLDEFASK